jgi:hypothetical protein
MKCAVLKCELASLVHANRNRHCNTYLRNMDVWKGCTCMPEPKPGSSSYIDGLKGPPLSTLGGAARSMLAGGGGSEWMGRVNGGCSR